MPYLGNNPTANFATVTKDTFSGDASETAFTLSKTATTNGVAVYVENVRQIPTTAYSVSGTTLTFTGAPPSGTNNIYVMHHNTPVSTATHPAAQALEATSGTFSAGVSGTTGTFTGAFTSLGIDDNADAVAMTIDSSERIGIGTTSPASTSKVHIKSGASGQGTPHSASTVIIEGSAEAGINILSGNTNFAGIVWGDDGDNDLAFLQYKHNDNYMRFGTNAQTKLKLAENGTATFTMKDTDGGTETAIWGAGTNSYIQGVSGEIYARDSAGNNTLLSPHRFEYIPNGASEEGAWAYLSKKSDSNIKTEKDEDGKDVKVVDTTEAKDFTYVNVDMMKVVREVEKLTGTKLVYTGNQDGDDGSTVKDDIIAGLIKRIEALESK